MKKLLLLSVNMIVAGCLLAQSVEQAEDLVYRDKLASAQKMLHNVLQSDPTNNQAWYLLAHVYVENDMTDKLKDSLQKIPESVLNTPLQLCTRGYALLSEGKKDEATPLFDEALKDTKSKDPEVLKSIANANINTEAGDVNYALDLLDKATKKDKNNAELYVLEGDAYRKIHDGTRAYQAYTEAISKDAKYAAAYYKRGEIFQTQHNEELYLENFNKAIEVDPDYAPAYLALYEHYQLKDFQKAMDYLKKYISLSDYSIQNDYRMTDMLYLTKQNDAAITSAQRLILKEGNKLQPRVYKLVAYCYLDKNDNSDALSYMNDYFTHANDTDIVVKDYEAMGKIYEGMEGKEDSAAYYYGKSAEKQTDVDKRTTMYKKIAGLYKKIKDYKNASVWLNKYYHESPLAGNVDLFSWGIAAYQAKDYPMSDSAFAIYAEKYPTQNFGYYWRARSNVAMDTAMTGMAIPYYQKVIEIDGQDPTKETNKKHLVEAYSYIAAYKANTEKDYKGSIDYFEKLLAIDPDNADAKKFIDVLKQNLEQKTQSTATPSNGSGK
jgi:tetratricopeptide (TPR) repeat protein